jgi:hypothetical protein
VGFFAERLRWRGADAGLIQTLKDAGGGREIRQTVVGFMAGHRWRNGWGIAAGASALRSERPFHHTDRRIHTEQTIVLHMVTLNTQVYYSDADTLITTTTEETTYRGNTGRSVLRVPVEGRWSRTWRRWDVTVVGGLAAEFVTAQADHDLMRSADGRTIVMVPNTAQLSERHPVTLSVHGGMEAGFLLNEHWRLSAGPMAHRGLRSLSPSESAYAMAGRTGVQVRLTHTLMSPCR